MVEDLRSPSSVSSDTGPDGVLPCPGARLPGRSAESLVSYDRGMVRGPFVVGTVESEDGEEG